MRQLTALERHGRDGVGLPQRELSNFITAKRTLAGYSKTISDAVKYYVDYLESVRRCKTTVAELMAELLEAKRKDGRSKIYLADLRNRLEVFARDFGAQPVAAVTPSDISEWLRSKRFTEDPGEFQTKHQRVVWLCRGRRNDRHQSCVARQETKVDR